MSANIITKCQQFVAKQCDNVEKFLDRHPTLYKVVIVACHFFRSAAMFTMMALMPINPIASIGILLGANLMYRLAVERFCSFRFALPSCVGATALWVSSASVIRTLSATVFQVMGQIAGQVPLIVYSIWTCYQSHNDVDKKLSEGASCCSTV